MIPKNMIFGPPLGSSSAQNGTQNRPSGAKNASKFISTVVPFAFLNRPCFSLNHSNYAAVGPYWILKRRFGMKVCSFFHIFLIFRLYIISPFFTPLFHKTTVNVQPLSPPVFNKIATHSKNLRFFILFVFGFACFQLVVIFVDFQIPLGTQLVQNGMKMVPKTDPLGCFLYNFDPHCPKKTTTHNTTNFLFRNLGISKASSFGFCDARQRLKRS